MKCCVIYLTTIWKLDSGYSHMNICEHSLWKAKPSWKECTKHSMMYLGYWSHCIMNSLMFWWVVHAQTGKIWTSGLHELGLSLLWDLGAWECKLRIIFLWSTVVMSLEGKVAPVLEKAGMDHKAQQASTF